MALTDRRWLTLAGLGCLALAVVYWPGAQSHQAELRNPISRLHFGAESRTRLLADAGRGLILLQLRDRILDSLARARGPGTPVSVQVGSGLRRFPVSQVDATAESLGRFLRLTPPSIRTVVITHPDAGYRLPNQSRASLFGTYYFLPEATNGRICLALPREYDFRVLAFSLSDTLASADRERRSGLMRAMGPCAYYTAFGSAGPHIEAWLRAQDYVGAGRPSWDQPPPSIPRPQPEDLSPSNVMEFWDVLRGGLGGGFETAALSFPQRACARGWMELCADARNLSFAYFRPPLGSHHAVAQVWWFSNELPDRFLSDLVRLEGPERFQRFWGSTLPVDQAFARAFDTSMNEWTRRWVLSYIVEPRFGPTIRLGSVLVGLALALVLTAASSLYATRRQVG